MRAARYFILLLCFLLSFTTRAQSYLFDHFTTANGLPSNMAYRCVRDAEGFIWVATSGGVARFDGQSFETFSEADGLPDNDVTYLLVDHHNRIWFFGFNGKAAFYEHGVMHTAATDKWLRLLQAQTFVLYSITDEQHNIYLAYDNSMVRCIRSDDVITTFPKPGNFFFAHDRLWLLPGPFEYLPDKYLYDVNNNDSMPVPRSFISVTMRRTAYEPSLMGNLIYFQSQDVYMLTNKTFTYRKLFRSPVPVMRLKYMSDTSIALFSLGGGIYLYDLKKEKFTQHLLSGETLTDAFYNDNGDLWCTSLNNGLFYLPASRSRARYITAAAGELLNEKCTAIFAGSRDNVWIGMDNAVVQRFAGNISQQVIPLSSTNKQFGRINGIAVLPGGTVSIASDVGMFFTDTNGKQVRRVFFYKTDKKGVFPLHMAGIKSCSITPHGNVLIAASNYLRTVSRSMTASGKPFAVTALSLPDRVFCAFEDHRGNTWIGTSHGLISIQGKDTLNLYRDNSLLARRILQIAETRSGYLVLATDGNGLVILKNNVVCAHFTAKNGLTGDICRRLFIVGDTVYAATPAGISIAGFDRNEGVFTRTITEKDGLLSADCRDVAVADSELYVATDKGVSIIALQYVLSAKTVPYAYLKKILVDGKPVAAVRDVLRLQYGIKSITINYGAVSQHATSGIEYRYCMRVADGWTITNAPSIVYTDPGPQQTDVTIQARYKGGAWGRAKTLTIIISPRFYQRGWFIVIAIFLLMVLVVAGFLFYYRKHRQKLYNQNRLMKLESQASQAMMNPHFVFNALNSVQHFLNENDNYAANQYLTRFSRLIRRHLELNRSQYISLEEEFDFLRLYLEVEKSRCEGKLSFSMHTEPGIEQDEIYVPVLILQPLVENAIWHGISPKYEGGHVEIAAYISGYEQLEIKIADDGAGFLHDASAAHKSMGLGIIRDRLSLLTKLYNREFSIEYEDATVGTTVIVCFPLLKEDELIQLL